MIFGQTGTRGFEKMVRVLGGVVETEKDGYLLRERESQTTSGPVLRLLFAEIDVC